jgi:hypothetical protein
MHNFIKKLFVKKEPVRITIGFDALPAWLNEREVTAHTALEAEAKVPMQKIRNATAELQLIVNRIAGAEQDPEAHPKLRSIAKNSLPLYVKAMNVSLGRALPDDVEAFYHAAAECVKGCLHSTHGQGRYLQAVFTGEMKEVRKGIDMMGREMNVITASLNTYRTEKMRIDAARAVYETLSAIRTDGARSVERDQRITTRIKEISDRILAIETELAGLPLDAKMAEVTAQKNALAELERKHTEVTRTYAALSMTASHVFRKAEKIAVRQKHSQEVSAIRHSMDMLSDHGVPVRDELASALAMACPVAERMIAAGEITLKNKEERAIFADTAQFCTDICTRCTDLLKHEEACRVAREALGSHPLLVKINSLQREKAQLESMLAKETIARKEIAEWQAKTRERIPALNNDLIKKIEEMRGESVQFQTDDRLLWGG